MTSLSSLSDVLEASRNPCPICSFPVRRWPGKYSCSSGAQGSPFIALVSAWQPSAFFRKRDSASGCIGGEKGSVRNNGGDLYTRLLNLLSCSRDLAGATARTGYGYTSRILLKRITIICQHISQVWICCHLLNAWVNRGWKFAQYIIPLFVALGQRIILRFPRRERESSCGFLFLFRCARGQLK